jgi:hypothetical protein
MMLLDDEIGNLIDSGKFDEAYTIVNRDLASNRKRLPITYNAGEEIPNLMILPPRRNNTGAAAAGHRLITVDRPGSLSDFMANMLREHPSGANVHWSACSEIVTRRRGQFGETTKGKIQNLFEVAELYYEGRDEIGH